MSEYIKYLDEEVCKEKRSIGISKDRIAFLENLKRLEIEKGENHVEIG